MQDTMCIVVEPLTCLPAYVYALKHDDVCVHTNVRQGCSGYTACWMDCGAHKLGTITSFLKPKMPRIGLCNVEL
jgi:hypothetical protein